MWATLHLRKALRKALRKVNILIAILNHTINKVFICLTPPLGGGNYACVRLCRHALNHELSLSRQCQHQCQRTQVPLDQRARDDGQEHSKIIFEIVEKFEIKK